MADRNYEEYELDNSVEEIYYHSPSKMAKSAFFYLLSAGMTQCAKNYKVCRRDNKSILLMYVLEGSIVGKCMDKGFTVNGGEVLILNCMNPHRYRVREDTARIIWFHFYGATSVEYCNLIQSKFGSVVHISQTERVREKFEEILDYNRRAAANFEPMCSLKIQELMTMLLCYGTEDQSDLYQKNQLVEAVVNYIKENYDRKLTVAEIAEAVNYDYFYLSHIFKEIIGESVYEYITRFKIDVAKRLLVSSELTVGEVSERVGYNALADFIRNFKKMEGTTPLKFRTQNSK